jgi:hypothetical protein
VLPRHERIARHRVTPEVRVSINITTTSGRLSLNLDVADSCCGSLREPMPQGILIHLDNLSNTLLDPINGSHRDAEHREHCADAGAQILQRRYAGTQHRNRSGMVSAR